MPIYRRGRCGHTILECCGRRPHWRPDASLPLRVRCLPRDAGLLPL